MLFLVPKPTPILQVPIPTIPIKSLSASGTQRSSNQLGLGGQLWAGRVPKGEYGSQLYSGSLLRFANVRPRLTAALDLEQVNDVLLALRVGRPVPG